MPKRIGHSKLDIRDLRFEMPCDHLLSFNRLSRVIFCLAVALLFFDARAAAGNWPQWRGPGGDGISREKDLPAFWDERRSILWKCELPEWGASTPIVWDDAVFVTSHTADNRLLLLRIDANTGQIVWSRLVGEAELPQGPAERSRQVFHRWHNMASPSPVTNGQCVVAHFGNGDLACFDFDGQLIWKRNLQEDHGEYTIWWGHANSPVLYEDADGSALVISLVMQDSLRDLGKEAVESYVVAHDVRDGSIRWKTERRTKALAEQADAYTTPLLAELHGRKQLVVMGGNELDAYDPGSGEQLWYLTELEGGRTIPSPTFGRGMIYAVRGMRGPLVAVRPPEDLTVTDEPVSLTSRDVVWSHQSGTPDSCSPVMWDMWLFTVTDDGVARCHDTRSGLVKWKHRLRGEYKASPVAVEGRLFFLNTEGLCTVVSAAPHFDRLTENPLEDETIASPAVANGRLFIRGKKKLYCIGRNAK